MYFESDLVELSLAPSSNGVFRKWYDNENKVYIKASGEVAISKRYRSKKKYHIESIMEVLAYEIGKLLGFKTIEYFLDTVMLKSGEEIVVCVSKDFMINYKERISLLSLLARINSEDESYENIISSFPKFKKDLDRILLFDFIIDNRDRHLRNIEIILDDKGSMLVGPIFDNGMSLLSDFIDDIDLEWIKEDEDCYENLFINAETPCKPFRLEHSSQIGLVDLSLADYLKLNVHREEIRDVIYRFKEHLSPLRLECIEKLVWFRYLNILTRINKLNRKSNFFGGE